MYSSRPQQRAKPASKRQFRRGSKLLGVVSVIFILSIYVGWCILRPLPQIVPLNNAALLSPATLPAKFAWPTKGQAAVGIVGSDIAASNGSQIPAPIASTAKVITALVVLEKKPISVGQQGPMITLTAADVALHDKYSAVDGSLVPVAAGEQISEYQMLQAIMLPSANNIADSLAVWAYGSLSAYQIAANSWLTAHHMNNSHVGEDASGFAPTSTSTAKDLVLLGKLAMQNPVLAPIAGQGSATDIPLAKTVKNVNSLLGLENIIGVKTGNTDQAGGVFIGASRVTINHKPVTIITSIVGSASLYTALQDSLQLIRSTQANFTDTTFVSHRAIVGRYHQPWGGDIPAVASNDVTLATWKGQNPRAEVLLRPISPRSSTSQPVGSIDVTHTALYDRKSVAVTLQSAPTKAPIAWRLLHPF